MGSGGRQVTNILLKFHPYPCKYSTPRIALFVRPSICHLGGEQGGGAGYGYLCMSAEGTKPEALNTKNPRLLEVHILHNVKCVKT